MENQWHEDKNGQLVRCPAKIKCRLGTQHYTGTTVEEAEANRENILNEKTPTIVSTVKNDENIEAETKLLDKIPEYDKHLFTSTNTIPMILKEAKENEEIKAQNKCKHKNRHQTYDKRDTVLCADCDGGWDDEGEFDSRGNYVREKITSPPSASQMKFLKDLYRKMPKEVKAFLMEADAQDSEEEIDEKFNKISVTKRSASYLISTLKQQTNALKEANREEEGKQETSASPKNTEKLYEINGREIPTINREWPYSSDKQYRFAKILAKKKTPEEFIEIFNSIHPNSPKGTSHSGWRQIENASEIETAIARLDVGNTSKLINLLK